MPQTTGRPKGAMGRNTIRFKLVETIASNRGITAKDLAKQIWGNSDEQHVKNLAQHLHRIKHSGIIRELGFEFVSEKVTVYSFRPIKESNNA